MSSFNEIFKNPKSKEMGLRLKKIINTHFNTIEEQIYGGAKVKLALYSRDGKNNVLCGIQESCAASCLLYVHHIDSIDHERLKFSGKGKHAKRLKFNDVKEINEEDVHWLLTKVDENAPF
ncbi:hypothetical protein Q2T40_10180 [Winogradskyella maritima]|uniref:YdhG-like domain-containing protein n=1 Tax=Winogradskyella maritima TaxID=1517766 RepID=A0ABV8AJG5_9FLAO|nr:hypothetical protein [Winogradskyella maritima]